VEAVREEEVKLQGGGRFVKEVGFKEGPLLTLNCSAFRQRTLYVI